MCRAQSKEMAKLFLDKLLEFCVWGLNPHLHIHYELRRVNEQYGSFKRLRAKGFNHPQ